MSDKAVRSLSSFEWASVGQYIAYLDASLGLVAVNDNAVYSFRFTDIEALQRLLSKKIRTKSTVKANIDKLYEFLEDDEVKLTENEKAVISSVVCQFKRQEDLLSDHIERASSIMETMKRQMTIEYEDLSYEEPPF